MPPSVYIIAGPNGAGKTTFARKFLPCYAECRSFVNADLIAQGLSPFSPESVAFEAGRMLLHEIARLARLNVDFGFETTLSGRGHLHLIRGLKDQGYAVNVFFLWLDTIETSLSRIDERVARGGHDVPEPVIRRRFERCIRNFLIHYRPLADSWTLFENSGAAPREIAFNRGDRTVILREDVYGDLMRLYGDE